LPLMALAAADFIGLAGVCMSENLSIAA